MTQSLILDKKNSIAMLTFNRPEVMNSLNDVMAKELLDVVTEIKDDPNIRVLILRGAGNQFMAGGDVSFFHNNLNQLSRTADKLVDQVHQVVATLRQMPQIVIASVHGAVAGIGISFMLAADLVVAASETKFTLAYSKIGTSPDGGASYFLPKIIGYQKAMELLLLSDLFDATQAQAWGLINWLVPQIELEDKTQKIAHKLSVGPKIAYASIKKLLNASSQNNLEGQLLAEKNAFVSATQTQDFKIGVNAFVNKNKAEFQGK